MISERKDPRPVLLTKTEAMSFAADKLEQMAADMELAKMMLDIIGSKEAAQKLDGAAKADMARIKRELPAPDLQIKAMREGAAAIRELALEERLVAARVGAPA